MKIRLALLGVPIALTLAGCGGGTILETENIEAQAKSDLEKKLPQRPDVEKRLGISADESIKAVHCPSSLDVEVGKTFTCRIEFANGKAATEGFEIVDKEADVHYSGQLEPVGSSNK
jgi:hypothetical protein